MPPREQRVSDRTYLEWLLANTATECGTTPGLHRSCAPPHPGAVGDRMETCCAPNAIYQEHVRAYVRGWFADRVAQSVQIVDGHILPPTGAGIGTALRPEVLDRPDARVQTSRLADG